MLNIKLKVLLLLFCATTGAIAQNIRFDLTRSNISQFVQVQNGSVDMVDFDNDGNVDVLITGRGKQRTNYTKLYKGLGNYKFVEVTTNLPAIERSTIEVFDYNGDGYEDIFLSGYRSHWGKITRLYRNNRNLSFTEVSMFSSFQDYYMDAQSFDADGDGDLDLYLKINNNHLLYKNIGNGNFQTMGFPISRLYESVIAFGDADGDNDIDFIMAGEDASGFDLVYYYVNNGLGGWTQKVNQPFARGNSGSINFVDYDGDGDNDVTMWGRRSTFNNFEEQHTNDGNGNFTVKSSINTSGTTNLEHVYLDVDLDGDMDQYTVSIGRTSGVFNFLSINDGTGNFTGITSGTPNLDSTAVDFADVDGDNDLDLFMIGDGFNGPESHLFLNTDSGYFETQYDIYSFDGHGGSVESADVDSDGDIDVLISHSEGNVLFKNNGNTDFSATTNHGIGSSASGEGKFADFNNDGHLDYIKANLAGTELFINDGTGIFTRHPNLNGPWIEDGSIDVGDFDGDGWTDFIISGYAGINLGYITRQYKNELNTSSNDFTIKATNNPYFGLRRGDVKVGDLDGDNDLDVIIMGERQSGAFDYTYTRAYYNNGSGTFSFDNTLPFTAVSEGGIDLGDVDGDGDLDVIISGKENDGRSNTSLYENLGNGSYRNKQRFGGNDFQMGQPAFSDVDQDGDLDLVFTGDGGFQTNNFGIYRNNGTGNFTELTTPNMYGLYSGDLMCADVNGDSYPEIIITGKDTIDNPSIYFYTNKGCESNTTITVSTCNDYVRPGGGLATKSGVYVDTLGNSRGCDSIIRVNLTINKLNVAVARSWAKLTAGATDVSYQWLDCNNSFAAVSGETSKEFSPSKNGTYAVEVSKSASCKDTSFCFLISAVGIAEYQGAKLQLFPNPSNGVITLEMDQVESDIQLRVFNITGQVVYETSKRSAQQMQLDLPLKTGIYQVVIETKNNVYQGRLEIVL